MSKVQAMYIWIDGQKPTAKLRSKTKVVDGPVTSLEQLPLWAFDGSSTYQATTQSSDLLLQPVYFVPDAILGGDNVLVLCEVNNPDGTPHASNFRAKLRASVEKFKDQEPWFGIEQEYTLFEGNKPLGWPDNGFPAPQGGYYCGVGADEVFGRPIVNEHAAACIKAGISIYGTNAEVMPAQWEYQIGTLGPLEVSDQLWVSRWMLYRIAEDFGVSATLYPKPVKGDWNGAGGHTNFSTKAMREDGGYNVILQACDKLSKCHMEHMKIYGAHNDERLTGLHETAPMDKFSFGDSHRGSSVRVPISTINNKKGYMEDRRPAANLDPYLVCRALLETICGNGFKADM